MLTHFKKHTPHAIDDPDPLEDWTYTASQPHRDRMPIASPAWLLQPAVRGAFWMVLGAIALTIMAAMIRVLSTELPVATIILFRSVFSLAGVIAWMALTSRVLRLRTRHFWLHVLRASCGATSILFLIIAYRQIDFALATALAFTTPFWVTILSVVFLGERPSWRRSMATALGFVGILVILRPLPISGLGVWAALASAAFGACALACVRRLSGLEPVETLLFYFFLFAAVLSAVPAATAAVVPNLAELGLLAATGLAGTLGLAAAAAAYRLADATVVAPLDFLRLPLAAVIGFVFFGEVPQWWLIIGTLIMIGALWLVVATGSGAQAE